MAKKFYNKEDTNKQLAGETNIVSQNTDTQEKTIIETEPKQKNISSNQEEISIKPKQKVGRPKTKDIKNTCKNINVSVPITLLRQWEDIKIVHGNNLTEYITKLIKKDMNANYEHYKELADSLKDI